MSLNRDNKFFIDQMVVFISYNWGSSQNRKLLTSIIENDTFLQNSKVDQTFQDIKTTLSDKNATPLWRWKLDFSIKTGLLTFEDGDETPLPSLRHLPRTVLSWCLNWTVFYHSVFILSLSHTNFLSLFYLFSTK